MTPPRTHPAQIRVVLADAATTTGHAAAHKHGYHPRTVYRWMKRRAADPAWPTDADVAKFEHEGATLGARRAQRSAQRHEWSKRVYLTGALMRVDPTGTTRRLRALYALGWTGRQVGARMGVSAARVSHLIAGNQTTVHRDTAALVARVYDELSMTIPRDPDVLPARTIRVHDRQRRLSARKGWPPPLAWDDIDDPNEVPTGWAYKTSARADRLVELVEDGAGLYEVLRDLQISRNTFNTWCSRNGHSDTYLELVAAVNTRANQYTQRSAS